MATLLQVVRRVDTVNTGRNQRPRSFAATQELVTAGMAQRGEYVEVTARYEMLDVSDATEAALRRGVQYDILAALTYPSMTERYEDIGDAFPETFKWAFEGPVTGKRHWDNFPEWLKTGSGVYWIGGKAGSGKSTLMKHIFDDTRTRDSLEQWAKTDACGDTNKLGIRLCLATFFFWNSGTVEQKSQAGLLRALLYQVLSHSPQLMPVVFPKLWAKRYLEIIKDTQEKDNRLRRFGETLTLGRLTSAFQNLARQSMVPLKICFLIDGLDEYSGDHEELALLFKMITQSPLIKVCLSSRPWVIFEQIYSSRPSMRLQDLTCNDIQHYVTSKFEHNSAFVRLQEREPESAILLRNEVIERAEGVFLWVEIVVRSLLLGIRNQDDIAILRQRLMAMPQELENVYSHLLGLIEGVYWVWASKAFQIVRATRDLCNDDASNPVYRPEGSTTLPLSTFFFAMAERIDFQAHANAKVTLIEKITPTSARSITPEIVEAECNISRIHLTARCAGLLEVPQFERKGSQAPIRFHHRTAREFIYDNARWKQMLTYTQGTSFDPHTTLFNASVLELACRAAHPETESGEMYSTVIDSVLYACHINKHNIPNESETRILDILDQIMTGWAPAHDDDWTVSRKMPHWTTRVIDDSIDDSYHLSAKMRMMRLATVYGLKRYVNDKLTELGPETASESASILLSLLHRKGASRGRASSHARLTVGTAPWDEAEHPFEQPEMVSILTQHGDFPKHDASSPNPTWTSTPRLDEDVLSRVFRYVRWITCS